MKQISEHETLTFIIDRQAREIIFLVASVRPSVRLCVYALMALMSAAKSNRNHSQSKEVVCVSVISCRMLIITQMRSIGF